MNTIKALETGLLGAAAVLVTVESTEGSVPRERGAWMAVFADRVIGTIGGGHLEWQAIAEARHRLAEGTGAHVQRRYALGPSLGQCCGGVVHLGFERLTASDLVANGATGVNSASRADAAAAAGPAPVAHWRARIATVRHPLALFGGGHVGHALARVLAPLPFALTWIDSREGVFPQPAPEGVECEHSEPVQQAVPLLAPGSRVLIMSFSHAEDLDVVAACLRRQRAQGDLPFVGLIGSQTKWATFRHRLVERGFSAQEMAHITCPIGVPGIGGKEPEVIAVAVAAQLLQTLNMVSAQGLAGRGLAKENPERLPG